MKILIFLLIHLITPAIGLMSYFYLKQKIRKESIKNPPVIDLFFVFSLWVGILMILLTEAFWRWSAMASLLAGFLVIPGLLIMGLIAFRNYKVRNTSVYHRLSFFGGFIYCFMILTFVLVANLIK
jgi:hypothetical protein